MRSTLIVITGLLALTVGQANGATTFGPVPYLQMSDVPSGLFVGTPVFQDFENPDGPWEVGFSIPDCGSRIGPKFISGDGVPVTDSVDVDDGAIDDDGTMGSSWFCRQESLTIQFDSPVLAAGFAFTDGDRRLTNVKVEFFGGDGSPIGTIDAGDIVDEVYTGTTGEDRYLGIRATQELVSKIRISIDAGTGLEIDHIKFEPVPEPSAGLLVAFAALGLTGWRRR